jgi:hypothetical protein
MKRNLIPKRKGGFLRTPRGSAHALSLSQASVSGCSLTTRILATLIGPKFSIRTFRAFMKEKSRHGNVIWAP